jgi:peptidoglycan hydrolase-like protein with peptidoglycan-binding domain
MAVRMALSLGARNDSVLAVQRILAVLGYRYLRVQQAGAEQRLVCERLALDSVFGPQTEAVLMDFQHDHGLIADGAAGVITMSALETAYTRRRLEVDSPGVDALDAFDRSGAFSQAAARLPFRRVATDRTASFQDAYEAVQLRADAALALEQVCNTLHASGAVLLSSGGRRALDAEFGEGMTATAMNYLGRAFDLFVYAGMVDPEHDPYVVELPAEGRDALAWRDDMVANVATAAPDPAALAKLARTPAPWFWRVWARCEGDVAEREVGPVATYLDRRASAQRTVRGRFIDLTALFAQCGFLPVPARPRFFDYDGGIANAQWWHFQYETGLIPGVSTFGGELLKVYSEATLDNTPPWKFRRAVFGNEWGMRRSISKGETDVVRD